MVKILFIKKKSLCALLLLLLLVKPALAKNDRKDDVRVSFSALTLLDKTLKKSKAINDFQIELKNLISKYENIKYQEYDKKEQDTIFNSEEAVNIGKDLKSDIVVSGSLTKLEQDIIINLRFYETVSGRIVYSKQYFVKDYQLKKIYPVIKNDFVEFIINIRNSEINVYSANTGKTEIRVKTIPSGVQLALDNKSIGTTPAIIKNLSSGEHLLETWRELETLIKEINIYSEDEQFFQVKANDKIYTEHSVNFTKINQDTFEFEVIANPNQDSQRAKIEDLKYDNRKFKLEIFTDPENVQVSIDGKVIGFAPTVIEINKGIHKIVLNKKKASVFKQYIDTSKNTNYLTSFNLFHFGKILISSNPQNAEIIADGEKAGLTPKSLELPIGKHSIELVKNGFKNEDYNIEVKDEKTKEWEFTLTSLRNKDTTTAFTPTAITDDVLSISGSFLSLGQYSINNNNSSGIAYISGGELNYGIKNLFKWDKYLNFGVQAGVFYNNFGLLPDKLSVFDNKGLALKLQLTEQNATMPISIALGSYYDFGDSLKNKLNSYLAITRDLDGFSTHFGVHFIPFEISALNFNIDYNAFYRVKISANMLVNLSMMTKKNEEFLTPLFGISAGYNFL